MIRTTARSIGLLVLLWAIAMPLSFATAQQTAGGKSGAWHDALSFEIVYTGEIWGNLHGGIARDARYLDNLDLMLTVSSESLGHDGGTFFFYVLHNNRTTFSDLVGDLQTVSNIDNDRIWRIFEAWYEQRLLDDRMGVKIGFMDLNAEFDAIDPGGLFVLSSHGIGPDYSQSGAGGPSIFPVTMAGVRIDYRLSDRALVRFAAFDAVPGTRGHPRRAALKFGDGEGALLAAEIDTEPVDDLRVVVGAWAYTARFDGIEAALGLPATRHRGNNGLYAFAHGPLYREPGSEQQGIDAWIRFGVADGRVNELDQYLGAGFVYTGLLPGRDGDQLGLAVAIARNGESFRRAAALVGEHVDHREINVELTWRAQITDWLALQPDVQFIVNPGTDPTLRNALVAGLRFEVGFQPF